MPFSNPQSKKMNVYVLPSSLLESNVEQKVSLFDMIQQRFAHQFSGINMVFRLLL